MLDYYYQPECVNALWEEMHSGKAALACLPCGAGKSKTIALLVEKILQSYPEENILVLIHVKELVEQNYAELKACLPRGIPISMYCASTGQKRISKVTVASIQSIGKNDFAQKHFGVIVVDEVDLIPKKDTTLYRSFIDACILHNNEIALVGLTATPFRLDSGLIYGEGELFPYVCYQKKLVDLIREGYLTPLVSYRRDEISAQGLRIEKGDYSAREQYDLVSALETIQLHVDDILDKTAKRKKVLIFAVNAEHCIKLTEEFRDRGIRAEYVLSAPHTSKNDRTRLITEFKATRFKYMVNVGIMSTGTNIPDLDCIVEMRLTKSKRWLLQVLGRGTRRAPGKTDCIILSYSGNFKEHGPIEELEDYNHARNKKGIGEGQVPVKVCPKCSKESPLGTLKCPGTSDFPCDHEFPKPEAMVEQQAYSGPISSLEAEILLSMEVTSISYKKHVGKSGIPVLKVTYQEGNLGFQTIDQYVCLQHGRQDARMWWRERSLDKIHDIIPGTIDEALDAINTSGLAEPIKVYYKKSGRNFDITGFEWG